MSEQAAPLRPEAATAPATPSERRTRAARRVGEFPPAPQPLPVPVIDSHTHLDITVAEAGAPGGRAGAAGVDEEAGAPVGRGGAGAPTDEGGIGELVGAATAVGVDRLVQVGVDVASSRWSMRLAAEYPAVVATVALHPNEAPRLPGPELDEALREIEALAAHPRVRGIGETGLDQFRTGASGRAVQEMSFRAHIAIAKRYGKPLVIHDRDAHADVLRVLDEEGAPQTVVLHCFSGDAAFAADCVRRGYLLSFAGTVTFKNAEPLREAARVTPLDQLLVETDAPYLTPMPHRGRPNASYLIPLTVRSLAETTGTDLERLCAAISATGDRVFGPWH